MITFKVCTTSFYLQFTLQDPDACILLITW